MELVPASPNSAVAFADSDLDVAGEHRELRDQDGEFHEVANLAATGSQRALAAPELTASIAAGRFPDTPEWHHRYHAVLAAHPHPLACRALAAIGPLGVLRARVKDPDSHVRYAALDTAGHRATPDCPPTTRGH